MSRHTPGPWSRRLIRGVPDGYIGGADAPLEGATYSRAVCKVTGRATLGEARANMALIEAAPELLAACEHVLAFLSVIAFLSPGTVDALDVTRITRAVKKATVSE